MRILIVLAILLGSLAAGAQYAPRQGSENQLYACIRMQSAGLLSDYPDCFELLSDFGLLDTLDELEWEAHKKREREQ